MAILHVSPENDKVIHDLTVEGACDCQPSIQDEGHDPNGYACKTVIHQFSGVTDDGKPMRISKVSLDAKTGDILTVERPNSRQLYGSRPRTR